MWNEEPPKEFEDSMLQFIEDSVANIHQTQDNKACNQWVKLNYMHYLPESDDSLKLALFLMRAVWNATPLASNRYRPLPLPTLKRNSPCVCGSGKKYKQCCLHLADLTATMDAEQVWPLLLEAMGIDDIEEALALHALPITALIELSKNYYEAGMFGDIIDILEPVFTLPLDKMKEDESFALNMLCNAYDDFELPELATRKIELLERLKDNGSRWIRSEAWQRLATIYLDSNDKEAAWNAFQTAQRLTPNSPTIDLLEINLLLGESKNDLAKQRAKIMIIKLRKNNDNYENAPFIEFLEAVAENPQEVSEEMFGGGISNQLDRLELWLEQHEDRRVPTTYKLESFKADNQWLQHPEIPEDKIAEAIQPDIFGEPEENELFLKQAEKEHRLITPKTIKKLEKTWSDLIAPSEAKTFPWEEKGWLTFLEKNPQCFDSIIIIADILDGLEEWQQEDRLLQSLSLPLAQRAWKIYESFPEQGAMPWVFLENRPLYNALFAIIKILKKLGGNDEAIQYAMRLIAINPNDNHGLRGILVNSLLAQKAYKKVFKLVQLYPDDFLLEMRMAETLSFWALGHEDNAQKHWQQIKKDNKHIKKYMITSKILSPELSPYGVTMGEEDEAWYYRESARDIWLSHKGAIAWLKKY